ncbi:MAG: transcription-repair coupling factor [Dehalococcoidia bacterium]|nr:transcription-repair coupling factor [Dehalococcoidia bacterium]
MNLSGVLSLTENIPLFAGLASGLARGGESRAGIPRAPRAFLLAGLYRQLRRPVLVITPRGERARQLFEEVPVWLGDRAPVYLFPEPDALPYEQLSSDCHTVHERVRVLAGLCRRQDTPFIVASAYAVARKTVAAEAVAASCQRLRVRSRVNLDRLLSAWTRLGYEAESKVDIPGTFSHRGGIIDIYPPDSKMPVRIELSGNEVESLRFYDPVSQRSTCTISEIDIVPVRELLVGDSELQERVSELDLTSLNDEAASRFSGHAGRACGRWFDNLDILSSLVHDSPFLDYLPSNALLVLDEPDAIDAAMTELDAKASEMRDVQTERGEMPSDFPVPYFKWPEIQSLANRFEHRLALEQWGGGDDGMGGFNSVPGYGGQVQGFLDEVKLARSRPGRIIVVSQQAGRLSELFAENDTYVAPVKDMTAPPPEGSITLVHGSLNDGWTMDGDSPLTVITDHDIFGFVRKRRASHKRPIHHDELLAELRPGDYVVHVDHGIARFSGVTNLEVDMAAKEYLILEYAAGDKLYVPNDQIDRVARYIGPGGYEPALSRLGTQEWQRAKQRVKEAAVELAGELLALYSARQLAEGLSFPPDTVWQQELEASFPYLETSDQLKAVEEVKEDMEKAQPMDRLVCGDVGYGKTEVAIRAAFKAVTNDMQVAMLVPTTVLARQHVTTFRERMAAFPIRIESLSRLRSPKKQRQTVQALVNGAVDICIGTHRLLQKDVSFKNLGLVIIDEEQRFGVAHKERLKQLRKEVDVLTLSATPIPRTLHMGLVGIRDMSCMETPPEERLPIKTFVGSLNDRTVREAILRELDRNGQVFYVYNRVQKIGRVARHLQELVPEAKVGIGHGQMPEEALESVMLDFADGKIDILVCTTIIESGLDLPNVNTLIVEDADRLGLTQLYQLRGRVGRGAARAYAYFFYSGGKQLTDTAQKRLRTIYEATELGAGFQIAMKDLEIRGAGNVLGPEQSGHMGAVGYDLYTRLLSEAISEVKGRDREKVPEPVAASVNLPVPAYIPEEYVSDLSTRMSLYLKLSRVRSLDELSDLETEFRDRFGGIPPQVADLFFLVRAKTRATVAGIREVSWDGGQVVLKMAPGVDVSRSALQQYFADRVKVGPRQVRLYARRAGKDWRKTLERLIETIIKARDGAVPLSVEAAPVRHGSHGTAPDQV